MEVEKMDVDTVTVKTEKDNKAIVKKSKYPERYDEIHDCYTSKDYQGCLNQIALVSEEHVEYQILRSACLIHLGHKISEAHAILDEILVRHPNNAYTVYAKGLAYYHESEWEKSCEHFEKARQLDQTSDMIRAEVMMEKARAKANAAAAVAPKATSSNVIEPEAAIVAKKSKPVFRLSLPHSTSFSPSGSKRNIRRFGCELCNHFFGKKYNLDRHNRSLHRRDTPDNFPTSPNQLKGKKKAPVVAVASPSPKKKSPVKKTPVKKSPAAKVAVPSPAQSKIKIKAEPVASPAIKIKAEPSASPASKVKVNKPEATRRDKVKCPKCKKWFKKGSYARHAIIHTGNKQHKCTQCSMAFFQKSDLARHLATHSDELNFECDLCDRKFRIKKNLQVHKRRHHSN